MGNKNSVNKIYPLIFKKEILIEDQECSICLKKFNNDNVTLPCKHNFHENCITMWLNSKNNCPLCRSNVIFIKK